ncbi:hypothetical protein CCR91_05805 [Thiorhodovibrio winogradskyi]|nr:hypothetical protein [Thiorhodovibrio winogradskyi]
MMKIARNGWRPSVRAWRWRAIVLVFSGNLGNQLHQLMLSLFGPVRLWDIPADEHANGDPEKNHY